MLTVTLDQENWNRVLAILSEARWNIANPLIMAIGDQLRQQVPRPNGADDGVPTTGPFADGGPPNRPKPQ